MESYFDGQVAVVTGGGSGIGRATARLLSAKGAKVAIVDRDEGAGPAVAGRITGNGGEALFVQTDVSRPQDVTAMAEQVLSAFGKVDILINNAATFPRSMLVNMTWEEWQQVIDVNLHGPFLCTKALVDQMIQRRSGKIVNIASGLGITGGVKAAHYATSKGGLITFTKCLALELAPYGITANVLVPGLTDTDMPRKGQSEGEIAALVEQIPLKRLATPDEVAAFLAFVVSPACAYVTGQTMCINGGWIMP